MVLMATNRHARVGKLYAVLYGVVPVLMSYIAAQWLELTGVALSLLVAEILLLPFAVGDSLRLIQMSLRQWWAEILKPPMKEFLKFKELIDGPTSPIEK
jgi:predicted Na+-dependent transporter